MSAILARMLDVSEYGTYRQLFYVYNSLIIIFTVGLPKAYSYFLAKVDLENGKDVVSKLTYPLLVSGFLFSIILFFLATPISKALNNQELSFGLKIFSPIPFLLLPTLGIEGIFAALKKSHIVTVYHFVTKMIMLIAVVLPLIVYGASYEIAIYGWIAGSFFSFVVAMWLKFEPFKNIDSKKSHISYSKIFKYTIPLMTASIFGIVFKVADKFFISRYFGEEVFAIYSNGFTEIPFVSMVAGATSAILIPVFAKNIEDPGKKTKILSTWISAWKKSSLIIYPILIYFFIYAGNVILILYGDKYFESIIFFRIYIFTSFFNVIMYIPIILALDETRYYSWVHFVFALSIWPICYLSILIGGNALAIGIIYVAINAIKSIWFMAFISKKMGWTFRELIPLKHISKVLIHAFLIIFIVSKLIGIVFDFGIYIELFVSSIIVAGMLMLTSSLFKLDYWSVIRPLILKKLKN
jgi:O-antigen/teichoic acid export membrane protein